ncbi:MAG: hypothetical protein HY394_00325 [Candidatus Diapherotrites archaeon]|nr:hypothetical protein [Candidatus Diapherotrites archaeon]
MPSSHTTPKPVSPGWFDDGYFAKSWILRRARNLWIPEHLALLDTHLRPAFDI